MTQPTSIPLTPPLEALYWTQYSSWYPLFRKHAPKSTVIDINSVQPELLAWLDSDTFVLPEGSGPSTYYHKDSPSSPSSSHDDRSQSNENEDEEEGEQETEPVKLEKLDQAIRAAIEKYDDGPVFPKLNWSAPLDAGFMLPGNNLQCLHPEDVYMLLKSSEFVGRDLEQIAQATPSTNRPALDASEPTSASLGITTAPIQEEEYRLRPQLVLKKWFQLSKSYEFRCFVRAGALIAVSQRDVTFYGHLQSPLLQSHIRSAIWDFWSSTISQNDAWKLSDYVFDVYLTKDLGRVWLVDMNAWLPRTDPLLFSFEELEQMHIAQAKIERERRDIGRMGEEMMEGVVRLHLNLSNGEAKEKEQEKDVEWSESDVELRVLVDRRMQSAGGTSATYSSNMVPKDLVEFAKTNQANSSSVGGESMSVDQIVKRWNEKVDSEQGPQTEAGK